MTVFGVWTPEPRVGGIGSRTPAAIPTRRSAPLALVGNATLVQREDLTSSIPRLVIRPHEPLPSFVAGQ